MAQNQKQKIEDLLSRGAERIIDRESLKKKLFSGKRLRIKHGIDPTGPQIHLGRAAQLLKLKDFQGLGHRVVLIIGDFTAQIGDASDKTAIRKPLTEKEIKENLKDYARQIGKVLDIKKIELRRNSEWWGKMTARQLLKLGRHFTAQQAIQRRNFKERWDEGKAIGLHELNYPLLQGYDSVAVKADVEIGGFDQLFNLGIGRDVQKIFGQKPQDIMTLKMLYGLDGRKMSTSWGNVVNILDDPKEQFGKIMSMGDNLIMDYYELCTRVPLVEVKALRPRDAKARLAEEIVSMYHGKKAAEAAEKEFNRVFKEKKLPSKIPTAKIKEKHLNLLDLLVGTKLAASKAEAKRLVEQGGVKIDGNLIDDWKQEAQIKDGQIVQVGKRRFVRIIKQNK